tara:strand:- start:197 stop:919 length:723 start_codon:yes stop_codon:yes gene_type:complete
MDITYLVTVFNEVKTVKQSIQDVISLNIKNKEIVIIDNGSTDGSSNIVNEFKDRENITVIIQEKNLGFANTIKQGIKISKGEFIYIQFSDLEYDHHKSIEMLKIAKKDKVDVVLGSRLKNDNNNRFNLLNNLIKKPSYIATLLCTFLINIFYRKNLTDIIGSRLYNKESILKILEKSTSPGPGFDFELVSLMCKHQFKIKEIFTNYTPRANSAEKKIKFYHIYNALFEIFKIKFFYKVKF